MKNTLKTTMLLAAMGALIMFISSFWGSGGLTIGLFLALAMVGGSYWMSDKLAIRSARAIEVEEGQLPEYWSIMKELCDLSGQPCHGSMSAPIRNLTPSRLVETPLTQRCVSRKASCNICLGVKFEASWPTRWPTSRTATSSSVLSLPPSLWQLVSSLTSRNSR